MGKELDALKKLNIGTSKEVLTASVGSPLDSLLQLILQDVSDQLRDSIDKNDLSASNDLKQSIQVTDVEDNGNAISIGITANFYGKYLNKGVNGTEINWGAPNWGTAPNQDLSFKDSILQWIPSRGIQLPPQFSSYDSFAFAIIRNKIKFGQKPKPWIDEVINAKLVAEMQEPIEALFKRSIEIQITTAWQ